MKEPGTIGLEPLQQSAGVQLGELVGLTDRGEPLVICPDAERPEAVGALTTVPLSLSHIGQRVILAFVGGDRSQPVILGCVQPPTSSGAEDSTPEPVALLMDDGRLTLTGEREIVLRCGKASITLTRAGKVLVKGAYLSSRSSGVHRIKGASVHVN